MNKEIPEGSYLSKNGYVIKKSSISEDELLFSESEDEDESLLKLHISFSESL